MKKRIAWIVLIVIALLIVALLAWRLWPQSFSNILPVDQTTITGVSSGALISRLEKGQPSLDAYSLNDREPHSTATQELLDILAASDYRPDLRNLLPWKLGDVRSSGYDGRSLTLRFYLEDQTAESIYILFMSPSLIFVSLSDDSASGLYHPTNPETLTALVEYIQTHGEMQ